MPRVPQSRGRRRVLIRAVDDEGRGPSDDTAGGAPPGLPGLHTWRGVYLFALGCFLLWVVLLAAFGWLFS